MLVRNKVRDYDIWKDVFDTQRDAGRAAGVVDGSIHYVEDVD